MDPDAFREHGKAMVDFVADYWESLMSVDNEAASDVTDHDGAAASATGVSTSGALGVSATTRATRRPLSDVKPGYIWHMIPKEAPQQPESWERIFADLEPVVLAANTNWHHPDFFAYYPTACSYAAIIGDMLSGGIASIGFTWNSSPAMTELEMVMTDWLAQAVGLPRQFLNADAGPGGGIIQSTASEATLVALLSARARAIIRLREEDHRQQNCKTPICARRAVCGGSGGSNNGDGGSPTAGIAANDKIGNVAAAADGWVQSTLSKAMDRIHLRPRFLQKEDAAGGRASSDVPDNNESQRVPGGGDHSDDVTVFECHDPIYFQRLIAYCSDQAHSSVEKDAMLCGVRLRKLRTHGESGNFSIDIDAFRQAIQTDRNNGLVPFVLVVTVGTTNTCGVDGSLVELGEICNRERIWLHVDAAYAGSFLLCDEFRYLSRGMELVDSFNFNAHKAMLINFDCSPMWFKNASEATEYFKVDPLYLKHSHQKDASDYRHLQVALGRRFRALKIWFVLRAIGIPRIQAYLRLHVKLAAEFAQLVENSGGRFELFVPPHLGLVCFRLVGPFALSANTLNERLNVAVNADRRIHLVPASVHGTYFLRFVVCSALTTSVHIRRAFAIVDEIATRVLSEWTESDVQAAF